MSRDIIRNLVSPGDQIGALKHIQETYIQSRRQGYPKGSTVPKVSDLKDDLPRYFQFELKTGLIFDGVIPVRKYALVPPLSTQDFDYQIRQRHLSGSTDSLLHDEIDSAMKILLDYATVRNADYKRRDPNLSYVRNRMIAYICEELETISGLRTNHELIRRLTQLAFFIDTCRDQSDKYFPEAAKDGGSNGFPKQLISVLAKVTHMREVIIAGDEVRSLGEYFETYGASLKTAVRHLGLYAFYFLAGRTVCELPDKTAGTTLDLERLYQFHVSNGRQVADQTTDQGSYEDWLASSVLGQLMFRYYEINKGIRQSSASSSVSEVNGFLTVDAETEKHDFSKMASYILGIEKKSLPDEDGIWSEFKKSRKHFPVRVDGELLSEGYELPAEIISLLGYLIEANRIAQQYIASKSTASFVGDYNMVHNAYLYSGFQAYAVQMSALKEGILSIVKKLDRIQRVIFTNRPRADTAFHRNSKVMKAELKIALTALKSVEIDRQKIQRRTEQLSDGGYLKERCDKASQYVNQAHRSSEVLHELGVLDDEQFGLINRYRPAEKTSFTLTDLEDPFEPDVDDSSDVVPGDLLLPGTNSSEKVKFHFKVMTADKRLSVAQMIRNETKREKIYLEAYSSIESQGEWGCLLPLLVMYLGEDYQYLMNLESEEIVIKRSKSGDFECTVKNLNISIGINDLFARFANGHEKSRNLFKKTRELFGKYSKEQLFLGRFAHHLMLDAPMKKAELAFEEEPQLHRITLPIERQRYLHKARTAYLTKILAIESAKNKIEELFDAVDDVKPEYQAGHDVCDVSWVAVDERSRSVPGDVLLNGGIANLTRLFRNINDELARLKVIRSNQIQAHKPWKISSVSQCSFNDAYQEVVTAVNDLARRIRRDYGVDVNATQNEVSLDTIKRTVEKRYRTIKVKPVSREKSQQETVTEFGKDYNMAFFDNEGRGNGALRFDLPHDRPYNTGLPTAKQELLAGISNSGAFDKLRSAIHANQARYNLKSERFRNTRNHKKLNYAVMGAAKAAAMQAYCNELMGRVEYALKNEDGSDAGVNAWDGVCHYLGFGKFEVPIDNVNQCRAFLRRSPLQFTVRLFDPDGQLSDHDQSFNCADHRSGSHDQRFQAGNMFGLRGNSALPATSGRLIDYIKSVRSLVQAYLENKYPESFRVANQVG